MSDGGDFSGGCLCGAVRYEARGAPLSVNHCHCVQCQKSSGAAMLTWAAWPADAVRIVKGAVREFQSSPGVKRDFCPACGSPLFWRRLDRRPATLDVTAGTLDDPGRLAPTEHIFVKSRRRWMQLADGLPEFHEYPPKS